MAYTPPTITPSGRSWTDLKAGGLHGQVEGIADASSATVGQLSMTRRTVQANMVGNVIRRLDSIVDNYTSGRAPEASTKADVVEINFALKALNAAVEEIGVLIDAN